MAYPGTPPKTPEGGARVDAAPAAAGGAAPSVRAEALARAADFRRVQGDLDGARSYAEQCLSIQRELRDPTAVGRTLCLLGRVGLSDRLRFVAGDFLADELPAADVLVFGHVLHDCGLDTKRLLIDKTYRALPQDGAIICYDAVIDDERRRNAFGLLMSLNMLIEFPDGLTTPAQSAGSGCKRPASAESRSSTSPGPSRWSSASSSRDTPMGSASPSGAGCNARHCGAGRQQAAGDRRSAADPGTPAEQSQPSVRRTRWAPERMQMTSLPIERQTSSNTLVNLGVSVMDQELPRPPAVCTASKYVKGENKRQRQATQSGSELRK
jgi:O-methyltransferase domain